MQFVCLAYMDVPAWEALPDAERKRLAVGCSVFEDDLRRSGCLLAGETSAGDAESVTLRHEHGQASLLAGRRYAGNEQLRGVLVLEARDLNHAVQLLARHPGLRSGTLEICAVQKWDEASSVGLPT